MRKDGKSQYTIKKEKLLKIKALYNNEDLTTEKMYKMITKIWEIVKDEK